MRIGIDARYLRHGVGRYTEELLTHLAELDSTHCYCVFTSRESEVTLLKHLWGNRFREIRGRGSLYSPWGQMWMPYQIARRGLHLFHATSYPSPLIRMCPLVVTIHDQAPRIDRRRLPFTSGLRGFMARNYYDTMNAYAVRYARHIITVSKQAKEDILRYHPRLPPDRISVIYHGVSNSFMPVGPSEQARVRVRHGLPRDYFLYVGTVNPGKNLVRVLEVFCALQATAGWKYKLVAVARADERYSDFYQFWAKFPGKAGVHLLDYVAKPDLAGLYSGAHAVIFPSLHESFGFPVLEAFACGTPVITSNTSALPEIAGGAALLVDPQSVEDIITACRRLGTDSTLRQALIEKGFQRAQEFSWRTCAQRTLAVYEGVLSGRTKS